MPRHLPLPPQLGAAFRVADARVAGVGEGRLRGADLSRPFYGVRAAPDVRLLGAQRYAPLLSVGARFSHTTAALIWGCPVDDRSEVHVTVPAGGVRPRGAGVRGHRSAHGTAETRWGLPVSDPITTFIELAGVVDLDTAVRAGDHLVCDPHELDPHDLRPYIELENLLGSLELRHDNGIRRARDAAALVRTGAESPTETDLRLLLERNGFRDPVLQYELLDERGRRVGWFDLAWPELRIIVEYDGDQHRTSTGQYEKDIRRFDRATALGWRVIRVRRWGLYVNPRDTIGRVTEAFTAAAAVATPLAEAHWSHIDPKAPPQVDL